MRYRINSDNYFVEISIPNREYVRVNIAVPQDFYDTLEVASGEERLLDNLSKNKVIESIRLIANESRGNILCATGQKGTVDKVEKYPSNICIYISTAALIAAADGDAEEIAAINAMGENDMYTIEMDFGEAPEELAGNIVMATASECAAALEALEDAIDALDEEENEES